MKHKVRGRKLGRPTAHREALGRNIVTSLFTYGRIVTTLAKAKEFRRAAERIVTAARACRKSKGAARLHEWRKIRNYLRDKRVAYKLVEDIAARYEAMGEAGGGYTRILRLGSSRWDGEGRGKYAALRLGDGGPRVLWELTQLKDQEEELHSMGRGKRARGEREAKELAGKKEGKT